MIEVIKEFAKRLARIVSGDYAIYHIYSLLASEHLTSRTGRKSNFTVKSIDESAINSCSEAFVRQQSGYAGSGSYAYACFDGNRIVGICFYWFGDRYLKRNFWPLAAREAKLVQIITLPEMCSQGVATSLIESSSRHLMSKGFERVYARIWHSNTPSLKAFERANWTRIATVIELNPLRQKQPIRIRLGTKSSTKSALNA